MIILLLAVAVCMDFWKQIIPNELIYIGFSAYVLSMVSCRDMEGLADGIIQAAILFICLFPVYRIRAIGAGDVKLLMMTGLFLAGDNMLRCVLAAFALGAVFGIIKFGCRKIIFMRQHVRPEYLPADHKIHFSLPICLSVLLKLGGIY